MKPDKTQKLNIKEIEILATDNNIGKLDKYAHFSIFDINTALWVVCAITDSCSCLNDMKILHK